MTVLGMPSVTSGEILGEILDGRYRLVEKIGEGGMASVYRAEDLALQRTVAVKMMHTATEASAHRRARTEISLLAALTHPSVVTVYDAHIAADGPSYLVMEYVAGRTLRDRLEEGPLLPDLVATLGMDLAEALHAVHDHGVVHRDIKPSNVLLWASPLPDRAFRAKLTDFGIACLLDTTRVTSPGTIIGTAAYLAPEQVRGEGPAPAADIYSLGLVLLEALTGRPAFGEAGGHESVVARLTVSPAVPDNLPEGWRELLVAMTAANPARRPTALQVAVACGDLRAPTRSTAEQLRFLLAPQEELVGPGATAAVGTARTGIPPSPTVPSTEPLALPLQGRHVEPRRRSRTGAIAAAMAVMLAGAVSVGFAVGSSAPPTVTPDVGGPLGVQVGERFGAVEPAGDPVVEPADELASDTGDGVAVVDRGASEEASRGNPNRGPGNNSGSSGDSNSGKGNGNGNSGKGNGG